jgi:hypothetical protein
MTFHETETRRRELALRALIQEAVQAWPQFDLDPSMPGTTESECHVSGADLVEWFSEWRKRAINVLYDKKRPA